MSACQHSSIKLVLVSSVHNVIAAVEPWLSICCKPSRLVVECYLSVAAGFEPLEQRVGSETMSAFK